MVLVGSVYVLLGPNGVDWKYYATVSPRYDQFYFSREFISWFIIDVINNFDETGKLMAFSMSTLLFYTTYKMCLRFTNRQDISFLTSFLLIFSNFYLLMSVNGLRQGISLIFILLSLYIIRKNFYYSFLFFIIAIFSHNSAIIFFPLIIIRNINYIIFILGCIMLAVLGDIIINIAAKNSNASPTLNKSLFMYVSVFLLILGFFHKVFRKYKIDMSRIDIYVLRGQIYLVVLGLSFYGSSAAYERLVYVIIPLLIVFASYWLKFYRPRQIFILLYVLLTALSSAYSLSHPSVKNNYLNL